MILLDTDHLTVLKYPESPQCARLTARMAASSDQTFATTIVNTEEQLRGWLAEIHKLHDVHQQVLAYTRLLELLAFLNDILLVSFDERAADEFKRLRKAKIRISSMDLKIACIALVHDVLLLSANPRDFRKVPELKVEDWLED